MRIGRYLCHHRDLRESEGTEKGTGRASQGSGQGNADRQDEPFRRFTVRNHHA